LKIYRWVAIDLNIKFVNINLIKIAIKEVEEREAKIKIKELKL